MFFGLANTAWPKWKVNCGVSHCFGCQPLWFLFSHCLLVCWQEITKRSEPVWSRSAWKYPALVHLMQISCHAVVNQNISTSNIRSFARIWWIYSILFLIFIKLCIPFENKFLKKMDRGHFQAFAGDTVLCSQLGKSSLALPLSTEVYKWVAANCWANLTNCTSILPKRSRN